MKKILLTLILSILLSTSIIAREDITKDEENTVKALTNLGIVEKYRSDEDLNQPLSAIDSMSMEIKSLIVSKEDMIARDKEIIERLGNKIINLEDENIAIKGESYSLKIKLDTLKKEKEDSDKLFAIIGSILFILSIK